MQLKVVLVRSHANVEEDFAANESTLVCSRSLSVSLVDYFFTSTDAPLSQVIGFHDMYVIYKRIHSAMSSSINFSDFCAGKVKQSKRNSMLESYEKYLAQHRLVDIIDLFHYCHTKSTVKTIILSMKSISGQTDRLLAQYLLESPVLSWSVHDLTTESTTKENLLKLIHDASSSEELDDSKHQLKHSLCASLLLLLDSPDGHALRHWPGTPLDEHIITAWECVQRKYSTLPRSLSYRAEPSAHRPSQILTEDEEHSKTELGRSLRQLLETMANHLRTTRGLSIDDATLQEVIDEFCQHSHSAISLLPATSSEKSALSDGTFIAYLCARQAIELPTRDCAHQRQRTIDRSRALPTIHETSCESDGFEEEKAIPPPSPIARRQPLRVLNMNSFSHEERQAANAQCAVVLTLASDGDKENLPVRMNKRAMSSSKNAPSSKKQKKDDVEALPNVTQ